MILTSARATSSVGERALTVESHVDRVRCVNRGALAAMPIHYICVTCREEMYLPDSKANSLASCPRCRLKFLAPAPNVQTVPIQGASPAQQPPQRPATPAHNTTHNTPASA